MSWLATYGSGFDIGKFDGSSPACLFDTISGWTVTASDGIIFADVKTLNIAKLLSDGVIFADVKTLDITKLLTDGLIFADVKTLNIAQVLSDGVIFADVDTFNIAKALVDGVIFSDSKVHDVSKPLVDGVIFSDSKVHDVSKPLVDGVKFSESKAEGDLSHTSGEWIGHKIYNLLNAFGWDTIQQIQEVWTKISNPVSFWTTKTIGASADWVKKNFSTSNWTKK